MHSLIILTLAIICFLVYQKFSKIIQENEQKQHYNKVVKRIVKNIYTHEKTYLGELK